MEAWWEWLRDPENQKVLYLIGGALATLAAAAWAVVKFVVRPRDGGGGVRASGGSIASGRDTNIGRPGYEAPHVISPGRFGPILYVVGFLLVGLGGVMLGARPYRPEPQQPRLADLHSSCSYDSLPRRNAGACEPEG